MSIQQTIRFSGAKSRMKIREKYTRQSTNTIRILFLSICILLRTRGQCYFSCAHPDVIKCSRYTGQCVSSKYDDAASRNKMASRVTKNKRRF